MTGFVSLVGAGPGDPELLTRKALNRLRRADLVLYDALVSPATVALAKRAKRFSVGKRAGRPSMRQETIHSLMIRAARRGQRVVRLKGGDPFVFGRGGEEALALRAANVPFEVVPGISNAIAAPALAGIPVTHRGTASAFAVIAGHAPASYEPVLTSLPPGTLTLVLLMAVEHQGDIASCLLARGWPVSTPAALIFAASRENEDVWVGTIGDLARGEGVIETMRPGTLVVGEVVKIREQLSSSASSSLSPVASAFRRNRRNEEEAV